MKAKSALLAAACVWGTGASAAAHNVAVEPEATARFPWWTNAGDFSWSAPYDLLTVIEENLSCEGHDGTGHEEHGDEDAPTQGGVLTSRAIFGWLDPGDVDVYSFTGHPLDAAQATQFGFPPLTTVIASPLPPACKETRDVYPAIALVAPCWADDQGPFPFLLEPAQSGVPWANDVPPGYCVLPQYNTPSDERVVFTEPHTATAWYLPTGCQLIDIPIAFDPVTGAPTAFQTIPDCDDSDTLFAFLPPIPGLTSYLVVWNTTLRPIDYTLNVGIDENPAYRTEDCEVEQYIANNAWTHGRCSDPSAPGHHGGFFRRFLHPHGK